MTIVKIDGVSNDVFIPDQITDEDKSFLLERTENIVGIVTRAKVEIGLELLKVEQRFRDKKEFGGPNGWYFKWLGSLGMSEGSTRACINAAKLVVKYNTDSKVVGSFTDSLLRSLSLPSMGTKGVAVKGCSKDLIEYVVEAASDSDCSSATEASVVLKKIPVNQLLASEELISELEAVLSSAKEAVGNAPKSNEDRVEYNRLYKAVNEANSRLTTAKSNLSTLERAKKELEAKYENWRSPEAVKQEFEEAIAKAREEERAKKDAAKQAKVVEKIVEKEVKVTDPDLVEQIEALKKERLDLKRKAYEAEESAKQQLDSVLKKLIPSSGRKMMSIEKQVEVAQNRVDALNREVQDSSDVTKVTSKNLGTRVELVNLTAAQWHELAITYQAAKGVCTDVSMIARAEDGIRKSMIAWLERLPLDTLTEFQQVIDARTGNNVALMSTDTAALTTIDV